MPGRRILITRARNSKDELIEILEEWGATILHCPTIEIVEPLSFDSLDRAINSLSSFNWIIFTSKNGVRFFLSRLNSLGKSVSDLANHKILPVGKATAKAIEEAGLEVTTVPKEFRAEGALDALKAFYPDQDQIRNCNFLFPRAAQGRELLVTELQKLGARVELVEAYRTVLPAGAREKILELLSANRLDAIVFTSPSTINNMVEILQPHSISTMVKECAIACIGPVTAQAIYDCGLTVDIGPQESTASQLAIAIKNYFEKN
jgi:uroporphyrinogen III methyltransferase / synthase